MSDIQLRGASATSSVHSNRAKVCCWRGQLLLQGSPSLYKEWAKTEQHITASSPAVETFIIINYPIRKTKTNSTKRWNFRSTDLVPEISFDVPLSLFLVRAISIQPKMGTSSTLYSSQLHHECKIFKFTASYSADTDIRFHLKHSKLGFGNFSAVDEDSCRPIASIFHEIPPNIQVGSNDLVRFVTYL